MNKTLPKHLLPVVESLCATGCNSVNEIIEILDNDGQIEATSNLNKEERMLVLNELKTIMSVYTKDD